MGKDRWNFNLSPWIKKRLEIVTLVSQADKICSTKVEVSNVKEARLHISVQHSLDFMVDPS